MKRNESDESNEGDQFIAERLPSTDGSVIVR